MPKLTLGLAANRTSYYDKLTNFYLTLDKPVQELHYTDFSELKGITHALCASVPALRLYEGQLPVEAIETWKAKYMKPFNTDMAKLHRTLTGDIEGHKSPNRAFDRPTKVNAASKVIEETPVVEPVEGEVSTQSVSAPVEASSVKELVTESPTSKKSSKRNQKVAEETEK